MAPAPAGGASAGGGAPPGPWGIPGGPGGWAWTAGPWGGMPAGPGTIAASFSGQRRPANAAEAGSRPAAGEPELVVPGPAGDTGYGALARAIANRVLHPAL